MNDLLFHREMASEAWRICEVATECIYCTYTYGCNYFLHDGKWVRMSQGEVTLWHTAQMVSLVA